MKLFGGLLEQWRGRKSASTLDLFKELFGGLQTSSGKTVTQSDALQVSAVFACLRVLAEGVAQVPLRLMVTSNGIRTEATNDPLSLVLSGSANEVQTSYEWRETLVWHAGLRGNHYSFINRNPASGAIRELIPFPPSTVQPSRSETGEITYKVQTSEGTAPVVLDKRDVFHVRGPSWDGWMGIDTLGYAREAIGLAAAVEARSSTLYANGVSVSGVYSVEGKLSEEQYKGLRNWLLEHYSGKYAGAPMVLDRGAKFTPTTMTGVDAQKIDERKMQVEEICRFFRVMPIMVGLADKTATYASSEQMFLAHVVHTLTPWYARIEQAINKQLLTDAQRAAGQYAHFVTQGLMRGAMRDRSEFYAKALGSGGSKAWMTQDEVRELEDMNPFGGDAATLASPEPPAPAAGVVA